MGLLLLSVFLWLADSGSWTNRFVYPRVRLCLGGTLGGWSVLSTTLGGAWLIGLERSSTTLGDALLVSNSVRLEWSLSKSAVIWRKATFVGLPLSRSGVEGWGFRNLWTMSSIATVALSVAEVVGILNLVGRKVTESEFCVLR